MKLDDSSVLANVVVGVDPEHGDAQICPRAYMVFYVIVLVFLRTTIATANADVFKAVKTSIESAVERSPADAILLSGGLDTTIVATLASRHRFLKAYTVALQGAPAPDLDYARLIAHHLKLDHTVHVFNLEEYIETLPEVVKVLRVFDPMEIRNSTAVYIGMKQAKKGGVSTILTGDACDELFAGYSFLFNMTRDELRSGLIRLWEVMTFSAIQLAQSLGMVAKIPFLEPEVRQLANQMDPSLLVVEQDGQKWGKWIVRKAFEDILPGRITWRRKTPIESGCGTTVLPQTFERNISDDEFHEKQQRAKEEEGIALRDKEQLVYYETFRKVFGARPESSGRACPQCRYDVAETATFCRTCGAYPI